MGNCLGKTPRPPVSTVTRGTRTSPSHENGHRHPPPPDYDDVDDYSEYEESHLTSDDEEPMSESCPENDEQPEQTTTLAPQRPSILLPVDPGFHPSANGRNGWTSGGIYEIRQELGRGAFGAVYKAIHKLANSYYADEEDGDGFEPEWKNVAIKRTRPNALDLRSRGRQGFRTYGDLERHCQEIKTLLRLQDGGAPCMSPILYLYEYFWTGHDLFMVTELLGQELDDWRTECEFFTERNAIDICRTILKAIEFMHSKGVVHRDIKLQNILFRENGNFQSLKIADFGLARVIEHNEMVKDFCGSVGYIAPEIYKGETYRFEVDMFAFGVMLFRLLSGERPFPATNSQILKRHTIELRYNVQGSDWEGVSAPAKDMVRRLLINKQERLTPQQALDHPWFLESGRSVLRVDLSHLASDQNSRSKAFVLSHAPTASVSSGTGNRFWIDASAQIALATIMSHELYNGRVIDHTTSDDGEGGGLICLVEEPSPVHVPVPEYISQLDVYTEKDCRFVCRQLAQAIKLFHEAGLAHRNLHLENVIVAPWGQVCLTGLQYAQPILENQPLTGHFGYLYSWYAFKAPEVDSDFVHTKSVDLWSLGAIMYMLLTGFPPFRGNGMGLIDAKHAGEVDFDIVPTVSAQAQRLVRNLLQVRPEDRITIEEVLNSEWMIEADDYLERFELEIALQGLKFFQEV